MKRYNTPHRSHVVKTRMTDEEYADFTERLTAYASHYTGNHTPHCYRFPGQ